VSHRDRASLDLFHPHLPVNNTMQSLHLLLPRLARVLTMLALMVPAACSVLPQAPRALTYDFGPAAQSDSAAQPNTLAPLVLTDVQASVALDSNAVLYRLAYADVQQLHPYTMARWTMAPAQLLRQRVREALSQSRTVLQPGDAGTARMPVLHLDLEEFSQVFVSASQSHALLRVRATLTQPIVPGLAPVAAPHQANFVLQVTASTPDAAGGVHALAQASDALVVQLLEWLRHADSARGP